MRIIKFFSLFVLFGALCQCTSTPKEKTPEAPTWLIQSDQVAKDFTRALSVIYPEMGSRIGLSEFHPQGSLPNLKSRQAYKKLLKVWELELQSQIKETQDPNLKIDLEILLENVRNDLQEVALDEKHGVIPFYKTSQFIYSNLRSLINDQSSKEHKKAAVDRFKFYMNKNDQRQTYIQTAQSTMQALAKKYQTKIGPYSYPTKDEVNKYLENSPDFVNGVKELLEASGRKDWQEEYKLFKSQIASFDNYIKKQILPKTSKKVQISKDHYALALKQFGNSSAPEQMISSGKKDFQTAYKELRQLAQTIAAKHKLKNSSPYDVNQFFKQKLYSKKAEVKKLYENANQRLTKIIQDNDLVSLPIKDLRIRVAGLSESKAAPIPHLNIPPILNNQGEAPEFVVPTAKDGEFPFDDFNHKNFALALTAHEGRPGHDLQFSKILEIPISLVRSTYAMNSVNAEGWALYAEKLVYPYLNDEEKFSNLQSRLWRIARYFLDPMVQSGQANKGFVIQILHRQLGLSKALAEAEYERYSFRMPGQAPSYYQGMKNILTLKADLEKDFGAMNIKCFNDTVLSFGLIPHDKLLNFKDSFKKCQQQNPQ